MTTETYTCASCQTPRPTAETYERIPRSGDRFCTDTAGCRRRAAGIGDPVGEVILALPPAVPGAACSVCAAVDPPGGVYQRSPGAYVCLDRPGCEERAVGHQYLSAWGDSSPDRLISAASLRAGHAAAGAETPPERVPLGPDELATLAGREALGRRQR